MSKAPMFLDLDAIVPEKDVVIKLDGKEHKLKPVTVEQFVKNMQSMEKINNGNLDAQTEQGMICDMLEQVFPSVAKGRFNQLNLIQLNALIEFARENGGENKVQQEATTEEQDPPAAG